MKIKYLTSLFISSSLFLTNIYANEKSLNDLIDIALKNNANIQISKNNSNIKEIGIQSSRLGYFPKVVGTVDVTRTNIRNSGNNLDDTLKNFGLSVNQLIYDFGKTSSSINSSKEDYKASKKDIISNISNTIYKTKEQYYKILNDYQQIDLAKEIIKIDSLHLEQAIAYFKAGVKTKIDVTDAKLNLSNSKLELIQSKYNLKSSNNKLISIIGQKLDDDFYIKKDKNIKKLASNIKYLSSSLDTLISEALSNRAEIQMYKLQIKAQNIKMKNIKSQYYPRIDFNVDYKNSDSNGNIPVTDQQVNSGVYLNWDIYTGNSTKLDIKNLLLNTKNIKIQLNQKKLAIIEEITNSYYKVKENEDSINLSLQNVDLSTQKLYLASERYKSGLNDLVELNDSKLQYTQSKDKLINIYYSYLNSLASLDYARGFVYK